MAEIILLPWVTPKAAGLKRGQKHRVAKLSSGYVEARLADEVEARLAEGRRVEREEEDAKRRSSSGSPTVDRKVMAALASSRAPMLDGTAKAPPRLIEPRVRAALGRCRYKRGGMTREERQRATEVRVVAPTKLREGSHVALFLEDDWVVPVAKDWLRAVWERGLAIVSGRLVVGVEPTMDDIVYALRQDTVEGSVELALARVVTDGRGKRRLEWTVE